MVAYLSLTISICRGDVAAPALAGCNRLECFFLPLP